MRPDDIRGLLEQVRAGETSVADALQRLAVLPFEDLGFARVDHHRALRTGFPEVIFGPGKTAEEIAGIVQSIAETGQTALVTRIEEAKAKAVIALLGASGDRAIRYEPVPRLLVSGRPPEPRGRGRIAVVSAGTSDRPVAEEAARTAELFGNEVLRIADVGVAGLHRVLAQRATLDAAEVVIVVAGMEGALPSVVAGLISRPVIAVPTSIGVGASFAGLSALLGMLNSCAPGVTVVNIDGGFSAGYAASLINLRRQSD
jgi:NCAIR mutase (PurE)-related protein